MCTEACTKNSSCPRLVSVTIILQTRSKYHILCLFVSKFFYKVLRFSQGTTIQWIRFNLCFNGGIKILCWQFITWQCSPELNIMRCFHVLIAPNLFNVTIKFIIQSKTTAKRFGVFGWPSCHDIALVRKSAGHQMT